MADGTEARLAVVDAFIFRFEDDIVENGGILEVHAAVFEVRYPLGLVPLRGELLVNRPNG